MREMQARVGHEEEGARHFVHVLRGKFDTRGLQLVYHGCTCAGCAALYTAVRCTLKTSLLLSLNSALGNFQPIFIH